MEQDIPETLAIGNTAEVQAATYKGELLKEMPNPTEEDLKNPVFEALWQATKSWDVNAPEYYVGYCGLNGSHIKVMLDALESIDTSDSNPLKVPLALARLMALGHVMESVKAGNVNYDVRLTLFDVLKMVMEIAQEHGLAVKLNMPTVKEKETYGTNSYLTVSNAEGKVLQHPIPNVTGVQLKD